MRNEPGCVPATRCCASAADRSRARHSPNCIATRLGPAQTLAPFDLIFCDPPYGKGLGEKSLQSAVEGGWAAEGAVVVLEERAGVETLLPGAFEIIDRRDYGETQIIIGKFRAGKSSP